MSTATQSQSAVIRWGFWLYLAVTIALMATTLLFPEFAIAETDNPFGPPEELKGDLDTAGKGWWQTIAIPGFWVALIAAVVLYITNYTQYMRIAIVAMLLFAWGDDAGRWLLKMGGVEFG